MSDRLAQDPVFWSFFLTTTTTFIFGIVKVIAKSKCRTCKFCGCCEIDRDIETELESEEIEIVSRNRGLIDHTNM
jgi:hypothetical protein